jgi:type I restriction enzyme, S subunit
LISKPKSKIFTYFIYFFLKKLNLSYLNRGSTQPLITKTDISKLKIIIPPDYVFINFDGIVRSNQRLIILLNKQNKILSQIRDTLLPKLITGKIRVNLKDDKEG